MSLRPRNDPSDLWAHDGWPLWSRTSPVAGGTAFITIRVTETHRGDLKIRAWRHEARTPEGDPALRPFSYSFVQAADVPGLAAALLEFSRARDLDEPIRFESINGSA